MTVARKSLFFLAAFSLLAGSKCGDGTHYNIIFPPATVDSEPKWSPVDSNTIAYTHFPQTIEEAVEYGDYSVWLADIEAGTTEYVAGGFVCDWSPDGNRIVLARNGLWIVDLNTGEEHRLTCHEGAQCKHFDADFCPTGQRIAYVEDSDPSRGIWILDMNSMSGVWISRYHEPDWSPSGVEILCAGLIIIAADGTVLRTVPHDGLQNAVEARWSPDGTRIALAGLDKSGRGGIWTINPDGSDLEYITTGSMPSWSPKGSRIAYRATSSDGTATAIWVINEDGMDKQQITFPLNIDASASALGYDQRNPDDDGLLEPTKDGW